MTSASMSTDEQQHSFAPIVTAPSSDQQYGKYEPQQHEPQSEQQNEQNKPEQHQPEQHQPEQPKQEEQDLRSTIWKIPQQARERAMSANRKSDHNKQIACIYNMNFILTEKEYSFSSSVDHMPTFIYKNLLSNREFPLVLRARYLNMLLDDIDFERYLNDIRPESYDAVRDNVNMDTYCFEVRNAMINHLDRYEKLCAIFKVPFEKDEEQVVGGILGNQPKAISVKEMLSAKESLRPPSGGSAGSSNSNNSNNSNNSGFGSRKGSYRKLSFTNTGTFTIENQNGLVTRSERDYDAAVKSIHNHQQYEDIIVNILLARSQDLLTKMIRLRVTQLNLIFDRAEVRNALENIDESRFPNIIARLTGGKEASHPGKAIKQPTKMIEGIKTPEDYFNEERIRVFNKYQKLLQTAADQ